MSVVIRWWILLGLVALALFASPALRAAEEPARDLTPILPRARKLFTNNDNDDPSPFRSYPVQLRGYGNGGSQSLSADGRWLLMADNNGLMLWDLSERDQRKRQPRTFALGSLNAGCTVLSPDGKTAVLVPSQNGGEDMSLRFFDTAAGKQSREIDNDQPIFGVAFSPDGRFLAVGTQQRIELWNAEDGGEVRLFSTTQNANYRQLTFSPDGKMIAALGMEPDTVHIWETASGKERASLHFGARSMLMSGGGRGAPRMGAGGMAPMAAPVMFGGNETNNDGILALAFSTDSRMLAVSNQDSAIHLWDLQTHRELPPLTGFRGQASALVFTADGKELIAVDTEGTHLSWRMAALRRNHPIRLKLLEDSDFAELWDDLAEPDAFRAYRARRHLIADPQRALPLLSRNLKPVPTGDSTRIQKLIKDLSSANAGTRRKAMTELRTKHGEAALGALTQSSGGGNAGMGGMQARMMLMMGGQGNGSQAAMLLLLKLQARYNTPQRQRDVLAANILGEIGTPQAKQTLTQLSKGAAGVELTTASKTALDHLAAAAKEKPAQATPEQLWTELASIDAARAFKAMCGLTAAPDRAVALLQKELKPIPVVPDKEIAALVDNLSSDDFKVREQATQSLAKLGEPALPALRKALGGDIALEARKRLERLIEQAASQTSIPLVRALRAIEVLEHTGTTDAKNVLQILSGGAPQAQLTREAKASLQRLARR